MYYLYHVLELLLLYQLSAGARTEERKRVNIFQSENRPLHQSLFSSLKKKGHQAFG